MSYSRVDLALRALTNFGETTDLPSGITASIHPSFLPAGTPSQITLGNVTIMAASGSVSSVNVVIEGKSGSIVGRSQPFSLLVKAGEITSIVPRTGTIPNAATGKPGTKVVIEGTGFCRDLQVQVGNPLAQVKPDSVTPSEIHARVPRFATTGRPSDSTITVLDNPPSGGISSTPPVHFAVDSYRNTAGFSFENYRPHTTFDQLTMAFGSDQTEDNINLCLPFDCGFSIHDPYAIIFLNFVKTFSDRENGGGACFGFALASQRLLAGQRPRGDFLPAGAPTNFDLDAPDARGGPSGPLIEYINSQNLVHASSEFLDDYLTQSFNNSFGHSSDVMSEIRNKIRDALLAGEQPIVSLRYGPFSGHSVVAYDVDSDPDHPNEIDIYVYDSNRPFVADEDANFGIHFLNVRDSKIHIAADGTWTLPSTTDENVPITGFVNELIVTRASSIPTHPTLPGALPSAGTIIFGSVGSASQSGRTRNAILSR